MLLRAQGITVADMSDVDERADYTEMIAGVRTGTCGAIGLPETAWEDFVDEDSTLEESVRVAETSVEIPYGVLVVPFAASLDVINELTNALLEVDVQFGVAETQSDALPETDATEEAVDDEATEEAATDETDNEEATDEATEVIPTATEVPTETPTPEPEPEDEATAEATEEASILDGQLAAFFGEGVFTEVDNSDFAELTAFIESTGLNLGQLGN
jgi:hypothetical protein